MRKVRDGGNDFIKSTPLGGGIDTQFTLLVWKIVQYDFKKRGLEGVEIRLCQEILRLGWISVSFYFIPLFSMLG
jgi:hypothetical protein